MQRGKGSHVLRFVGLIAGMYVGLIGLAVVVSTMTLDDDLGATAALAGWIAAFAWMSTRVGYRWFDAFLLFVPILGAVYGLRTLWRAASLPHAYWLQPSAPSPGRLLPPGRA
jgi:hypothetical protein